MLSFEKPGKKVTLLGAGLVGSLLAIMLAKRGYKVDLYERRGDMRKAGYEGGRSINLALSNRGLKALAKVGLEERLRQEAIPMNGRMMHDEKGKLTYQAYGKEGEFINSVSRSGLNKILMTAAEEAGVLIHFNQRCLDVDLKQTEAHFLNSLSSARNKVKSDFIIGADGAFSALRSAMQITDRFNYSQSYIEHGYKELEIPPSKKREFAMEPNALHIWPRGNFMMIALPNPDRSFTCTLFFPFEGKPSFSSLKTDKDITSFFETTFADAVPMMPALLADYKKNPSSSLVTVRCYPWVMGNCALIGDAAHAIVPFYGQGMNCGFEDCVALDNLLEEKGDLAAILDDFQKMRKPNGDAVAELALRNFVEMRDLVADPAFLLRKKVEAKMNEKYPDKWVPLYSMVTFRDDISYSYALEKGLEHDALFERFFKGRDLKKELSVEEIERLADEVIASFG